MNKRTFCQTLKTLILPLLIACVALGSTVWFQLNTGNRVREQAYEQLADIASVQDTAMRASLEGSFSILEAAAGEIAMTGAAIQNDIYPKLQIIAQNSDFLYVCVADAKGGMISSDGRHAQVADRAYFQTAMAGSRAVEKLESGRLDLKPRIVLAVPLIDNGESQGVVFGVYTEPVFSSIFLDAFSTRNAYSFLTDASGKGVAIASNERAFAASGVTAAEDGVTFDVDTETALRAFLENVAAGRSGKVAYIRSGKRWQAAYMPLTAPELVRNGWVLFHAETQESVSEKATAVQTDGALLSATILACAGGLIALYIALRRRKDRELKQEQERLRHSEEMHTLVENMTESILFDGDIQTDSIRFNRRFRDTFGREPIRTHLSDVFQTPPDVHPDDIPVWRALGEDVRTHKPAVAHELRLMRADGTYAWFRIEYMLLYDEANAPSRLVGKLSNIDAEKKRVLRLQSQAARDALTGLLNQETLREQIFLTLSEAGETGAVLLILDLDGFRQVNEMFGHTTGDEALTVAARVIRDTLPRNAILGRVGGDEFAALLPGVSDEQTALEQAALLLEKLPPAIAEAAPEVEVSASVGLASLGMDGKTFEELFQAADLALYQVKCQGRNGCAFVSGPGRRNASAAHPRAGGFAENPGIPLHALMMYMEGGVMLVETGESLRVRYVSPSYTAMPGMAEERTERLFRDPLRRVHPDDAPALERALRDGAENGRVVDVVFRVRTDGGEVWHHLRAVRIPYPDSAWPVLIAVLMDITAQHHAAAQLSAIIRTAPMGILLLERGERVRARFISTGVENLLAAHPEALARMREDTLALLDEPSRGVFRHALDAPVQDGPAVECGFRMPDSLVPEEMWITARMVYLERVGERDVILAMLTDATRRHAADRAQALAGEQLRVANDRMAAAIAQTQALLFEVSPAARTMTWWSCDGKRMRMEGLPDSLLAAGLVHPDSAVQLIALLRDIAEGREDARHALKVRLSGGGYLWCRAGYRFAETTEDGRVAIGALTPLPAMEETRAAFEREAAFSEAIGKRMLLTARIDLADNNVEMVNARDERFYRNESTLSGDALLRAILLDADEPRPDTLTALSDCDALLRRMEQGDTWVIREFIQRGADGVPREVRLSARLLTEPGNGHLYAFLYLCDVGVRRGWERTLGVRPERDAGSGVYARRTAMAMMRGILAPERAQELSLPVLGGRALVLLDITNMQSLCDRLGLRAVELLLRFWGRALGGWLDGTCIVGRMDNRRFGVLMPDAHEPAWLRTEVGRIVSVLTAYRLSPVSPREIDCAIGVGWMPVERAEFDALFALAENALERAMARTPAAGEARVEMAAE